jgi:integrase
MAVGKVTISSISKLNGYLWDTAVTGFGARKQINGVFYYVRYRVNGSQVIKSIGRHGALTPDTARQKARHLLGTVAGGVDPFAATTGETLATAVERYLDRKKGVLKPTSFAATALYLRKAAEPLHRLRLDQIGRRKIAALLGEIETTSGAVSRNRARSALSAMFAWAIQEGLLDQNPVTGTAKADEGGSRERVLTHDELRTLWRGLGDDTFSNVVRLLLLTGQRRNEIGHLQWSEIDLDAKQINLPASRVKNSRDHTVPLSAQALAIIEGSPRRNSSDFLFGERGFYHWDRAKARLDQRVGIADWHLHDLRRTAATQMAELGVMPHVIECVLNHVSGSRGGVAGIYNRSKLLEPMREALQRWADHVEALIVGPRRLPQGLMERAFAVARGGKIVPNEQLANLARQLGGPTTTTG